DLFNGKYEAGLFPDRCIFHFKQNDPGLEAVNKIVKDVKKGVCEQIKGHLEKHYKDEDVSDSTDFLDQYFQVYIARLLPEKPEFNKITGELFKVLDVLELQPQFIQEEKKHYMKGFLAKSSFGKGDNNPSFLLSESREPDPNGNFRFKSILEITAAGLLKGKTLEGDDLDWDTESLLERIRKKYDKDKDFRTYHKYIALVHIDGDNFGKIVKELDDKEFLNFSEKLTRFSLQVQQAVTDYGGMPVYIGGDDALFFAPLRYKADDKDEHIIDLLDEIDRLFDTAFRDMIAKLKDKLDSLPSLSAGVAVAYHKHPLVEALDTSRNMLFGKAKGFETSGGHKKNAVAFHVLKHSGMQFGAVLSKDPEAKEVYDGFKKLVRANIEEGQFLTSVIHTLARHKGLLEEVGTDPERVGHFLDNQFNEGVHENQKDFLKKLKDFIPAIYNTYSNTDAEQTLYGLLRMVKFLNRDD
ncbi:MAG: type III-B CRISPR-associated protein Cas10/Cmr2, partial [Cyclobacteriaceae bacterium]